MKSIKENKSELSTNPSTEKEDDKFAYLESLPKAIYCDLITTLDKR